MTLTPAQIKRQNYVDNRIMELIIALAPPEKQYDIDWSIDVIGIVRDAVQEVIVEHLGLATDAEFYPEAE